MEALLNTFYDDDDIEDDLIKLLSLHLLKKLLREKKKKKTKRQLWIREINKTRKNCGEFHVLFKNLQKNNEEFQKYFRMSKSQFEEIHELIKNDIKKRSTQLREPIGTKERLALCIRYLATGNSFKSLGLSYKMGLSTARVIVEEVCVALWKRLRPLYMPKPDVEMWKKISEDFKAIWNFPNCLGALDGKHVNIKCPVQSGQQFWNYKGQNSVVLLALVDAHYKFIMVDIGSYSRNKDGVIFEKSLFGKLLEQGELNLPNDEPLTPDTEPLPYVMIANKTFPMKPYIMIPYSKTDCQDNEYNKTFNFHLSQARRVVEKALQILKARWTVFQGPMHVQPDMIDKIVLASCCLHNFLGTEFEMPNQVSESTNKCQKAFNPLDALIQDPNDPASYIREKYNDYFINTGVIS